MICYFILEQLHYFWWKRSSKLPGPSFTLPFLGSIIEMVKNPYQFWEKQRLLDPQGVSANFLVGRITLFVTDSALVRAILNNNSARTFLLALHPSARLILGKNNIAFMHGQEHKELRKSFLSLFTRKALGVYLTLQETSIKSHLQKWIQLSKENDEMEMSFLCRDLNLETSQYVFAGPYIGEQRDQFCHWYITVTKAFISAPVFLPGTNLWKAYFARKKIVALLENAVIQSKKYIGNGGTPRCLLDFWTQRVLEEMEEATQQDKEMPSYSNNRKMAETLMDFLFASQDASTASLTWTLALMSDYPDVLKKVQEEQKRLRPNNEPLSFELVESMTYTRQVVKEILRYRPPAVMVPQNAMGSVPLTENVTVPKGSFVMPSIWSSCMQGFPDAYKFDPDRMSPERQEDIKYRQNFLTFGIGPHVCVGREYAINNLIAFLALISTECKFQRYRTKKSDDIIYLPTIYPGDCLMKFV
ncbi:Cytochrome P450 [Galdieria sulphuraria]|nr:Cytochrome P450 [Galdieria sulphuraria]